jgi:hypothetical protein
MMAHQLSIGEIKDPKRTARSRDTPKEGTNIRRVYDLLMENRGRWVIVTPQSTGLLVGSLCTIFNRLNDSYGLDIRRGYGKWLLAGEWFGKVYIDYVVEK